VILNTLMYNKTTLRGRHRKSNRNRKLYLLSIQLNWSFKLIYISWS